MDSERADTSETTRGGADTAASSSSGDEVDKLLMLASQQFEKQDSGKQEKLDARFATPKTDEEVIKMRQNAVPQKNKTRHWLLCGMLGLLTEIKARMQKILYSHCFS